MACLLHGGITDIKGKAQEKGTGAIIVARVIVTGGVGFMGRWMSKHLVELGHDVRILDNLSNCTEENIRAFRHELGECVIGDIKDRHVLELLFKGGVDVCIHMAAAINVQESIDNPRKCLEDNVVGTFNVLEECRRHRCRIVFISSALVYATADGDQIIAEDHPLNPSCPYAASKISGEKMVIAYHKTYDLPAVILRPFSIYGPWQRSDSEGGVMSIFINNKLMEKSLNIYGDGEQGRDFFYIEDCAEFIALSAFSDKTNGEILNAGSGQEMKIKELARIIGNGEVDIRFVDHHHLHAEIMHMKADAGKAKCLLNWEPKTDLQEGIRKTTDWLASR